MLNGVTICDALGLYIFPLKKNYAFIFLGKKNGFIYEHDEGNQTSLIIRKHRECIVDNAKENVPFLADHLYTQYAISKEEQALILENQETRDQIAALLTCVERKGWLCLKELVNAMNGLQSLQDLAKTIEADMIRRSTFHFFYLFNIILCLNQDPIQK